MFLIIKGLTKEEIVAQGLLFFIAGYDTTAIAIMYLLYNLALNPDIQDKVYEEIMNVAGERVRKRNYVKEEG